jgi:hypothetical protein
MAEFRDGEGRTWHPRIDLGVIERFDARSDLGLFWMLARENRPELLKASRAVPLLWEACRGEAAERDVDYDTWRAGLNSGATLAAAMDALADALSAFFPAGEPTIPGAEGADEDRPTSPGDGSMSMDSPPLPGSRTGDGAASEN